MRLEPKYRASYMLVGSIIAAIAFLMAWYRISSNPPASVGSANGLEAFSLPVAGVDLGYG